MNEEQLRFRVPDIKFRVLIVGRANAGKTSILKRVCETTESPKIYRVRNGTREEIRLDPTVERGDHNIEDELVFTNHDGYIFHDSCGFEAGNERELQDVQDFVRKKARAPRLQDRLHTIWYCIPMENDRPVLDMKFFGSICPDKNVPVIAVFTKFDQFKRDIRMKMGATSGGNADLTLSDQVEKIFEEQYWSVIKDHSPRYGYVRLEGMHKGKSCDALIAETASALSNEVVTLMLLAVQRGNLEMSVKMAVQRTSLDGSREAIIKSCTKYFPHLWLSKSEREQQEQQAKHIFDQLCTFFYKIQDTQSSGFQTLLVSILLLECATVLFASTNATLDIALQEAFNRLTRSYSDLQVELSLMSAHPSQGDFLAFIQNHKLEVALL